MAAPAFRSKADNANDAYTSGANFNIAKPSGVVDGDVLVAFIAYRDGDSTVAAPTGWTQFPTGSPQSTGGGTGDIGVRGFTKVASSEGASYDFVITGANRVSGSILAYSGADTTTPVDVSAGRTGGATADGTPDAPSVTTTVADTRLVCCWAVADDNTFTAPGSMTERVDIGADYASTRAHAVADEAIAATGATGVRTGTFSAIDIECALSVALRPSAGGATLQATASGQSSSSGTAAARIVKHATATGGTRQSTGSAVAAIVRTASASGQSSSTGTAAPHVGKWATASGRPNDASALVDAFADDTVSAVLWPNKYGTLAETGGNLVITPSLTYSAVLTANIYAFAGMAADAEVVQVGDSDPGTTLETFLEWRLDVSNKLTLRVLDGQLRFRTRTAGVDSETNIAYDPVAHRWWRIAEQSGTLYFQTSPDGMAWTTRRSVAAPSWALTNNIGVQIGAGWSGSESAPITNALVAYAAIGRPASAKSSGTASAVIARQASASGASTSSGTAAAHVGKWATATGAAASTGAARGLLLFAGRASGVSTSSGVAVSLLRHQARATGASASSGTAVATIAAAGAQQATASGTSTSTGAARGLLVLQGRASGSSASTGAAQAARILPATASGQSTSSGVARGLLGARGAAAGASISSGTAAALVGLKATASGSSASTGSASALRILQGRATGVSTSSGSAPGLLTSQGRATGTSSSTGTARALRLLQGATAGQSASSGTARPTVDWRPTAAGTAVSSGSAVAGLVSAATLELAAEALATLTLAAEALATITLDAEAI